MKIWKVTFENSGETELYSEETDILSMPEVAIELGYLEGAYEDEREEFIQDVRNAQRRGYGSATIEERVYAELVATK